MELRKAEEEMGTELVGVYNELRQQKQLGHALPQLQNSIASETTAETSTPLLSATEQLEKINVLQSRLVTLSPLMRKFRKRSAEIDPVTDKPRYGDKTLQRVEALLALNQELMERLTAAFGKIDGISEANLPHPDSLLHNVRTAAAREQADLEAARQAESDVAAQLGRARVAEQELVEREEQERQAALRRQELEAEQAATQARQEARDLERRIRQEDDERNRQWMNDITKGPDGVRDQLQVLLDATQHDVMAQKQAVASLHTLFGQIVAHPEEPNFRRVRRDHAQFTADVGQYAGGAELLIAAGFRTGRIDEVPCFISTEPDLERDMDAWSAWFDLLKATKDILAEALQNG